jgi:PKD repeat protein
MLGMFIEECDDSTLVTSNFTDCGTGLHVKDSNRLLVEENVFLRCGRGVVSDAQHYWQHKIEYQDFTINRFIGGRGGLRIGEVFNVDIGGNDFTGQEKYGLMFQGPQHVHVHQNSFMSIGSFDIQVYGGSFLNISENEFEGSNITLSTSNMQASVFHKNVVNNTTRGVYIDGYGNNVTWNTIMNTQFYGLSMSGWEHLVHHNRFIDNGWDPLYELEDQVYDNTRNQTEWDDGNEGNYWGDYEEKYPNATQVGNVWSDPYKIRSRGNYEVFDRFPLVNWDDSPPRIRVDAGENLTVNEGVEVRFNGTVLGNWQGNLSFTWHFTDGGVNVTLTGQDPTHTFTIPGSYEVWLHVEDQWRYRLTDVVTVTVIDALPPVADAGEDIAAEVFEKVTFDGSGSHDSGGITEYLWTVSLGDEVVSSMGGRLVTFDCVLIGTFNVTLLVTDAAGLEAIDTLVLEVVDLDPPNADAGSDRTLDQHGSVLLDGSGSHDNVGIEVYKWTIETRDGPVTLEGETVTYTFEEAGTYVVTLWVSDGAYNYGESTIMITVKDTEPPVGDLGQDEMVGRGDSMTFDASDWTDNVDIVKYTWTIEDPSGERTVRTGERMTQEFSEVGYYTVTLTVEDSMGNTATDSLVVHVSKDEPSVDDTGTDRSMAVAVLTVSMVVIGLVAFYVLWTRRGRTGD